MNLSYLENNMLTPKIIIRLSFLLILTFGLSSYAMEGDVFHLKSPLTFFDPPLNQVKHSELPTLLLRKGRTVELSKTGDDSKKVRVNTVTDYRREIKAGSFAYSTQDMREEETFIIASDLLNFLEKAKVSSKTRLPESVFANLNKLPADFITKYAMNPDPPAGIETAKSIGDLVKQNIAKITAKKPNQLTVSYDGSEITLLEIVRADSNHDGQEDSLLAIHVQATGGTATGMRTRVLDRLLP